MNDDPIVLSCSCGECNIKEMALIHRMNSLFVLRSYLIPPNDQIQWRLGNIIWAYCRTLGDDNNILKISITPPGRTASR